MLLQPLLLVVSLPSDAVDATDEEFEVCCECRCCCCCDCRGWRDVGRGVGARIDLSLPEREGRPAPTRTLEACRAVGPVQLVFLIKLEMGLSMLAEKGPVELLAMGASVGGGLVVVAVVRMTGPLDERAPGQR